MYSLYFGLVVHLLLVASSYSSEVKNEKDDKMLIMLEIEPVKNEDRSKRASTGEATRQERQSPEVPQDYLNFLQQLSAQQQQPQASATVQQPQQQQLIQQLVVSRDGSRQPTATRYVLSQDGRLIDESSLAGLGQGQQLGQSFGFPYSQSPQIQQLQQQFQQQFQEQLQQQQQQLQQQILQQQQQQQPQVSQQQPQVLQQPLFQQNPLLQQQPQQIPPAPAQTIRPGTRPQISEYTRQQQRILQEYRDAPLRAQIAGVARRPVQRPPQPVPTGPNSQSAQIFTSSSTQQQPQQPGALPQQFQDPQNPNIIYTPVPFDPQAYAQQQQLFQQQLAQQQIPTQYTTDADPSQLFAQAQRAAPVSQQIIYQQPIPQDVTQDKIRRPINVLPAQSAAQPQLLQQGLPQQYLIETSRPSAPQPPQYASSNPSAQIQYVQQPEPQPAQQQPQVRPQEQPQSSTLLQPVAGRGLFGPSKPSRSSIFVSRSSIPKSVAFTAADDVTSERVPVVRLPPPSGQKPLSQQELDALVSAGYTVTPVQDPQLLKSKRQPTVVEERRNHVVYQNPEDGVQYQYSPGSSDATATITTKN